MKNKKLKMFDVCVSAGDNYAFFTRKATSKEEAGEAVVRWLNDAVVDFDSIKFVCDVDELTERSKNDVANLFEKLFGDNNLTANQPVVEEPASSVKPKKRKDLTFKDIYDAVQPKCSADAWGPGEKSHIVKVAKRKGATMEDVINAMGLETELGNNNDELLVSEQLFS